MLSKIKFQNKTRIGLVFLINLLFIALLVSCSKKEITEHKQLRGLYLVVDRACDVSGIYKSDCENARFIELVKGQFYGIKNHETALVIWRGDAGEELLYQARKVSVEGYDLSVEGKVYISDTELENEYLEIKDGKVISYQLAMKNVNQKFIGSYNYSLTPVMRSTLPEYKMNYPSSD